MKLSSWNVNGIRAATKKGFVDWLASSKLDIVCIQETKAQKDQLDQEILNPLKYHSVWHSAEKKGYSGVSIYFKKDPISEKHGIGKKEIDSEGRVLTLEYDNFFLVNSYFPNSGRDHSRLEYKIGFCKEMAKYLKKLRSKGKEVLICGDFNIAHEEIDLANPKTNQKNAGFLPEERAWMTGFLKDGFVDVFRHFNSEGGNYTWWSYRPGVRDKNIGWRLDYFCASEGGIDNIKKIYHQPKIMGSDHCPVVIELYGT